MDGILLKLLLEVNKGEIGNVTRGINGTQSLLIEHHLVIVALCVLNMVLIQENLLGFI